MEPIREGLFAIKEDQSDCLLANRCGRCEIGFFPRRANCIRCLKDDALKDITLCGTAKLHTYTTVYRAPSGFKTPYMVGYLDFEEEGIRVFAQLTACKPEDLEIGMKMELLFEEMEMEEKEKRKLVYKFKPAKRNNRK